MHGNPGDVKVSTGAAGAQAASRGVINPSVRWKLLLNIKANEDYALAA